MGGGERTTLTHSHSLRRAGGWRRHRGSIGRPRTPLHGSQPAPGLGGRGNVGIDGMVGWGKVRDQTGTSDIKGGRRGNRPRIPQKVKDKAKEDGWRRQTMMEREDPMEWECTTRLSTTRGPMRSLCLPVSCQPSIVPAGPCPGTSTALFPTTRASPPTPHPVFLAHTPHFLGARAPPPLQTCSAHPAAAGRAHS